MEKWKKFLWTAGTWYGIFVVMPLVIGVMGFPEGFLTGGLGIVLLIVFSQKMKEENRRKGWGLKQKRKWGAILGFSGVGLLALFFALIGLQVPIMWLVTVACVVFCILFVRWIEKKYPDGET